MMGSDDAEGSGAEAPEGEGRAESSSFPQSSGKEVVLPTGKDGEHPTADTEATLLAELQRRCDKIIELEVRLDQERERANRLERERTEEDEALSGELRDIMATVNVSSSISSTAATLPPPPSSATSIDNTPAADDLAFDSAVIAQQKTNDAAVRNETTGGMQQAQGGGSTSSLLSASGIFSEWRLGRIRGGRNDNGDGEAGSTAEIPLTQEQKAGGKSDHEEEDEENKMSAESLAQGTGGVMHKDGRRRGEAAGALRARVVELELQRAEATEVMREKMDRSVRLEVQVEQLKNVVQSLSHASVQEETHRGWGGEGRKAAAGTAETSAASDLDSLLRDVPGIDPSVLLLLHRSPWADGVMEGVRKEETCFEWQGSNSRGQWSTKPGVLPSELSSLPHHPTGPLLQPPSPPSRRPNSPTADPGATDPKREEEWVRGRHGEAGAGPEASGSVLREKIGGAVAALGAVGRGLGSVGGAHPGGRLVTDEGVTMSFDLDKFALPSDHWEWVGGWMVDSETEASSDQDGWIYGHSTSEISEIALGRKFSRSGSGQGISSGSTHDSNSSTSTASTASGSGGRSSAASIMTSPTSGHASESQQQQQRQRQQLDNPGGVLPDETTSGGAGTEAQRKNDKADGGASPETPGSGGGDDAGRTREPRLRRRRLVRVRMVARVDGALESTTRVLELIRRMSSMEVLVRKLSRQVVAQQRQVTGLENQVAFLAPLQPKLRMVCALGKKDRMRGDAFQKRLIEAENELKVLRRCMGPAGTSVPFSSQQPAPPSHSPSARRATAAPLRAATLIGQTAKNSPGGLVWAPQADGGGTGVSGSPDGPPPASGGGGAAAWGWVEGVAQRAAGTLTRRPRADPGEEEEVVGGEPIDIFSFDSSGRGDAGTPV